MVSNTSVSCARNGNGKKIWLFDIDIVIDLFSVKIEAKQALAAQLEVVTRNKRDGVVTPYEL